MPKNVIVVGMPRSGTSIATAIFSRKGYYIGGSEMIVGDVVAYGVAKWENGVWSTLGEGAARERCRARVCIVQSRNDVDQTDRSCSPSFRLPSR